MRLVIRTALYPLTLCCLALGVLVLAGSAVPVFGQALPKASPRHVALAPEGLEKIAPAMQKLIDDGEVAGIVTMVARRGKVVQLGTYGMMDVEADKAMQPDTIFRIYSMSKPVTSVALMMLCEEGKLQLDDPVSKYLVEFKGLQVVADPTGADKTKTEQRREMTVRDLLRHTSGLTYGFFSNTVVDQMYRDVSVLAGPDSDLSNLAEMVTRLGRIPLLYQPGTRWHYSVSTDVLGRLVELRCGQTLDAFFAERIFRPLGMDDTGFYVPAEKIDRLATNYGPQPDGSLTAIDAPATSRYGTKPAFFSGGGGLVSTAGDYMRFCLMLAGKGALSGKRLLKAETVELMTKNHLPDEVMPIAFGDAKRHGVGFGLGFSVRVRRTDWEAASRVGEYGWGGAASTHFWISPNDEIVVVALTQYMPYSDRVERTLKPVVYDAIVDGQ